MKIMIDAPTRWGQEMNFIGFDANQQSRFKSLMHFENGRWVLDLANSSDLCFYSYQLNEGGKIISEFGNLRKFPSFDDENEIVILDQWRSPESPDNVLYSSPYYKSFFKRDQPSTRTQELKRINFSMRAMRVGKDYKLGIIGNVAELGNWDPNKVVFLEDHHFPVWGKSLDVAIDGAEIEYKYVIYSCKEQKIVTWEAHENRNVYISKGQYCINDEYFRYPVGDLKAAGVAIPVFSIRTENSSGVGEFADIPKMVDWAKSIGMRVLQVLPVNDTVATHTWVDSYPYAAISVHALHPIYASMEQIGALKDKKTWNKIKKEATKLNQLPSLDYEKVMQLKSRFFKLSYDENKADFLEDTNVQAFIKTNESWLIAYAVFSCLRDRFGTVEFQKWGKFRYMTHQEILEFAVENQPHFDDVAVHYYIQYYLDRQLKAATAYARSQNVVLKGDIPIGIFRGSLDAWRWPHLFNMDAQTGAPPDDFSVVGQNWGFPTYNWQEMKKDNYGWWVSRMTKMSDYFDVFRIDHILGFFRIWEMPIHAVDGLLGQFSPALPFTKQDIENSGIYFDESRMCKPYITNELLVDKFGENLDFVSRHFLIREGETIQLKPELSTQRAMEAFINQQLVKAEENAAIWKNIRLGCYSLCTEILFVEDKKQEGYYHPRINLHQSYSFSQLSDQQQYRLQKLHNEFFYHRHNDFWKESAMEKLPMLKAATDMLICGEDLGMVPHCVSDVMRELQILRLAIQRMPSTDQLFWEPAHIPYLFVTSTGSHDVSNIREWWHEDRNLTQQYYNHWLNFGGEAPENCEPWVMLEIVKRQLQSPAMLAIFPWQDMMALSEKLSNSDFMGERINIPANIPHYWQYRMHLSLEDLMKETAFNENVFSLIDQCGRYADY